MTNRNVIGVLMLSASTLFLNTNSKAQQLELSSTSHSTTAMGPLQSSNPASLFRNVSTNSAFTSYTPATTFSVSLSNQQYTSETLPGVILGYTNVNVFKPISSGVGSSVAASSYFTSSPNIATTGTNLSSANNYGFLITVDPGYQQINNQPLNARNYYADVTISFNRPVINPVLHFCGMGKALVSPIAHPTSHMYLGDEAQGFYSEFELSSTDVTNGITLTKLSGDADFSVIGANKIMNSNTVKSTTSSNWTSIEASLSAGSVRVNSGNTPITSVTFRLYLRGDGGTNYTGYGAEWPGIGACIEDFTLSASLGMVNLSGTVYEDNNGMTGGVDGSTMPGVTVGLFENNGTTLINSTTTNSSGSYTFSEIPAGEYVVKVTSPASYSHVSSTDATPTDGSTNVTLDGIVNVTNVNFGLKSASLPFLCNSLSVYQTTSTSTGTNSTLWEYNPILGTRISLGTLPHYVNALAYNPTDGHLWVKSSGSKIGRIGANGIWEEFTIPNLGSGVLNSGTISTDGYFYLYTTSASRYYVVDVNPSRTATYLQLVDPTLGFVLDNSSPFGVAASPARDISDWAYNPVDGQLYAVINPLAATQYRVMKMNPLTGVSTLSGTQVSGGGVQGSDIGGSYFDGNGNLYALRNASGHFYRINLTNYSATRVSTYSVSGVEFNDATACYGEAPLVDLGDAPDTYGTQYNGDGAAHIITDNLKIGSIIDADADGQPSNTANGDDILASDDEDGISVIPPLPAGTTTYQLDINLTNTTGVSATLAGWIDFNKNGTFDNSERAQVLVANGATSAKLVWNTIPVITNGTFYLRIRLATDALTSPKGAVSNGEVEDYQLNSTALPVKLVSFAASKTETNSILKWATTEETNSDHFEVQHSQDADRWSVIGKVNSAGDSKVTTNYQFSHSTPVDGINYYRLRMIDRDETFAYSRIVSVHFQDSNNFNVYPNPASRFLKIDTSGKHAIQSIELIGMQGKTRYLNKNTTELSVISSEGLNISSLIPGAYVVKITAADGVVKYRKIIVNH